MREKLVRAALALTLCAALPAAARAAGPVVLFDEGHGQKFLAGRTGDLDLSGFAGEFRKAGFEVRTRAGKIDEAALKGVAALVISGAFAPVAPDELDAIGAFLAGGGRMAVMLHVPHPLKGLLEQVGIQHTRGPLHEADGLIGGRTTDFLVSRLGRHPLTEGLTGISVFGCWGLNSLNPQAAVIAATGQRAWVDVNGDARQSPDEPVGSFGTVAVGPVGKGAWVIFGDDAMFQNRFLAAHNAALAQRLTRWLAGAPVMLPSPRLKPAHQPAGVTDL